VVVTDAGQDLCRTRNRVSDILSATEENTKEHGSVEKRAWHTSYMSDFQNRRQWHNAHCVARALNFKWMGILTSTGMKVVSCKNMKAGGSENQLKGSNPTRILFLSLKKLRNSLQSRQDSTRN
jgi:hypothetical protein